jgi:hypothetical protein
MTASLIPLPFIALMMNITDHFIFSLFPEKQMEHYMVIGL